MIRAKCRHCSQPFAAQRRSARYCSPAHRVAAHWRRTNAKPNAKPHLARGTGDDEWFTPVEHVERAREVLGAIDLDPASNDCAQSWIEAEQYFTAADDGLTKPWRGRVWLNPPYSRKLICRFVDKLLAEIAAGHVTAAILLVNTHTDTAWFHAAAVKCAAICFPRGRIKFVKSDGARGSPLRGQAFLYFGRDAAVFRRVFEPLGFVRPPYKV